MRSCWLVTYDISDPTRLRRVHRTLRGYGDWLQLSVFRCDLSPRERVVLQGLLESQIHHTEDQVLFIDLGPSDGRGQEVFDWIGRPMQEKKRAIVL